MSNEKSEKGEVTEKKATGVAVPSFFEDDAGAGFEHVTAEDLTVPRLKILQALSPEVNRADGKYVDGAVAGDIFNTVTRSIYSVENGCVVIPATYKRMFLEWQPRESGGGLVNQYTDAEILKATTKNSIGQDVLENGNYIQTSATHYGIVVDEDGATSTVMIPMAGTQLKKSRAWNSVMASLKVPGVKGGVYTPPPYSHKYLLKTVPESNDKGNWFGWSISLLSQLTEKDLILYEAAKEFSKSISFENSFSADTESL